MRKAIKSILTFWILVSSMFVGLIGFSDIGNVQAPYIPHDPIRINNNAEFASTAGIEGWAGDGSSGSPYIIEEYDINGSGYGYCIYIGNTTIHFEVKDSYLREASGCAGDLPYYPDSGIVLNNVQNGIIANNTASNNVYGISLFYSSCNIIANNNVSLNNDTGILLSLSDSNLIANNTASNNQDGINLYSSSSNIIANNTASNNQDGINLHSSSSNTITKNSVSSNNAYGLSLYSFSNSNTVTNNKVLSNYINGILLTSSDSNTVNNNTVSDNHEGIILSSSDSNTIANNTISSDNSRGIWLDYSNRNTIVNNNASNNEYGIYLSDSNNNTIYHNNIINNTNQAFDNRADNYWHNGYPSGGNYWSDFDEESEGAYDDYREADQKTLGSDGIVDNGTVVGGGINPYVIDSDSQDNYPLIAPIGDCVFLYEGWNLVSIPFIQSDTNLNTVLSSIGGSYDTVWWYNISDNSDHWKVNNTSKPSNQNDLDSIDHLMGFWIHITKHDGVMFEYSGIPLTKNRTIKLHPGWNLVGYPSQTSYNRRHGLNNLKFGTQVESIWTFDAANRKWEELGLFDYFKPGRGYWINAKVECTWEVPL